MYYKFLGSFLVGCSLACGPAARADEGRVSGVVSVEFGSESGVSSSTPKEQVLTELYNRFLVDGNQGDLLPMGPPNRPELCMPSSGLTQAQTPEQSRRKFGELKWTGEATETKTFLLETCSGMTVTRVTVGTGARSTLQTSNSSSDISTRSRSYEGGVGGKASFLGTGGEVIVSGTYSTSTRETTTTTEGSVTREETEVSQDVALPQMTPGQCYKLHLIKKTRPYKRPFVDEYFKEGHSWVEDGCGAGTKRLEKTETVVRVVKGVETGPSVTFAIVAEKP